jgi:hypothetical protein
MKKELAVLLGLTMASAITVIPARAQPGPMWTVDENGPAVLSGPIVGYSNGAYKLDPLSGMVGWYYQTPPSTPGDVVLLEQAAGGPLSDLLRFDGQGVFFFSDLEPGELNPDKADVPVMPIPINPVVLQEIGPEGNNGALYFPNQGMPGFDQSGQLPGLGYNFISDAVPEPGSAALLVGAAVLLGGNILRRKARA